MRLSSRARTTWFAVMLVVLAGMVGAVPAYAITGGQPDNGAHPQVGLIVNWSTGEICTGTLIASNVVLTAGHCTYSLEKWMDVEITFDDQYTAESSFYSVRSWATHYAYDPAAWPNTVDVGLLFLKGQGARDYPLGYLPDYGTLETLIPDKGASEQIFTDVGYGQSGVDTSGSGRPTPEFPMQRRVSWQTYQPGGYDDLILQLKASPSSQHGSGCGGDSGGPIFLGDTATIVAIHTGGRQLGVDGSICGRVASLNHRIDTAIVLDWLYQYI